MTYSARLTSSQFQIWYWLPQSSTKEVQIETSKASRIMFLPISRDFVPPVEARRQGFCTSCTKDWAHSHGNALSCKLGDKRSGLESKYSGLNGVRGSLNVP